MPRARGEGESVRRAARSSGLVTAVAAIVALTACGTTAGHAVPGLTVPDVAKLKVGPYQSKPFDYKPRLSTKDDVFAIESRRLLGYLTSPDEIDPEMNHLGGTQLLSLGDSSFVQDYGIVTVGVLPQAYKPALEKNNLIAGAYTSRNNDDLRNRKFMSAYLMRFPSDAAAQSAAQDLEATPGAIPDNRHPLPLSGFDNAHASSLTDAKGWLFVARGPYVLLVMLTVPKPDANALTTGFQKYLSIALPRLDRSDPTAEDDILDLPQNPSGIMRLALPPQKQSADSIIDQTTVGPYEPAGQLQLERDAGALRPVFAQTGVDLVGKNDGTVYRTRDTEAAFRLQAALTMPGKNDEEFPNPPGITDAHCLKLDEREPVRNYSYLCAVVYDRYVAVVGTEGRAAGISPSFYQRVAAQYAMLVDNG